MKMLGGSAVDASSLRGKVVVMNFWATWCAPCVQEIPWFNKLYKELAPKGVAFVGVSMDDDAAQSVAPFLKKHPIDYPVALGTESLNDPYGLDSLPVTIVFSRDGRALERFAGFTGEAALRAAIDKAL